jgi:hypothetical protein
MRPRYLSIALAFSTIFVVILLMVTAGTKPPNTADQLNSPTNVRNAPAEGNAVQVDAGAVPSTTLGPPAAQANRLPEGLLLIENHCLQCHKTEWLKKVKKSPTEWTMTLAQMETMGVDLEENEKAALLDYLVAFDHP